MLLPLIGLLLGVALGILLPLQIPVVYSHYFAVVLLGILDAVLTGLKHGLEDSFDVLTFWSGLLVTLVAAILLVYIGERLGVELYLALLFAFGYRILNGVSDVHSLAVEKFKTRSFEKREN